MSIQFGDILRHNNPNYPIVDVTDIKGGLRSITTFGSASLISEYTSGASGSIIPEKYKSGYSLLLETSTGNIYYFTGIDPTNVDHWSSIGITGTGSTNTIPKWISPSILGNSSITDNGDTVVISSNLMVIGTTSTVNTENLLVKDAIILLAGSQSGSPMFDAGLFINRGTSDTQAFIWDESMDEFKFITTTSGATVSGDVSIGTYSSVRTGVLSVGTGTQSNSRFIVSSSGGTVSLVADEFGNVYNILRGITNTLFGYQTGLLITGTDNTTIGYQSLYVNTTGYYNTAVGSTSMRSNLTGFLNTAIGYQSLYENSSGSYNTTIGASSLLKNLSGSYNTAIGVSSLLDNRLGSFNIGAGANSLRYNRASFNTAIGYNSLYLNTVGNNNTAVGYQSLYNNTSVINTFGTITPGSGYVPGTYSNLQLIYATGSAAVSYPKVDIIVDGSGEVTSVTTANNLGSGFPDSTTRMTISNSFLGGSGSGFEVGIGSLSTGTNNTGIGSSALFNNTTGDNNTAVGQGALDSNSTGSDNTGVGQGSLQANTTGNYNTAVGKLSMYFNTTGDSNTAIGWQSLPNNTTGYQNTGLGRNSLFNNRTGVWNTAIGDAAIYYNTSGNCHTGLGLEAGHRSTTGISVLGTFSGGSGYTPGTYSGVQLKYSSGPGVSGVAPNNSIDYYPIATIVVGTGGTISSVTLETSGRTFATSSTIMTSTASEIGPGEGFTVGITSIQTAENNTAVGFKSLWYNTIGSNNVSFGHEAGNLTSTAPYLNHISDNSVYIGYYARAKNSNETNQIVIGYEAYGNGSNTVTLGNDNVIKTYLKGFIQLPTGPTTSTGTYSILTRNDITGEIERITPYIINWYAENVTPPTTTPVATGTGSIAIGNNTQALSSNMFVYGDFSGFEATGSDFSNFIGYYAGFQTQNSLNLNVIGNYAGFQSSNSGSSNFIGDYAGFQSSGSIKSNFIGDRAGLQSPGSEYSNFIGGHAGVQSPNTGYSNFFGRDAGNGSGGASYSNFFGRGAGQLAGGAFHSNFIGDLAGHQANTAHNSNFLGQNAGSFANTAHNSNFLGHNAGNYAGGSSHSNFFGNNAGSAGIYTYSFAHNSNFFGNNAGQQAINANNSNFIGERAGKGSKQGNNSNFLGQGAGQIDENVFIYYDGILYDLYSYQGGNYSNFIGANAGISSVSNNSNFFGQNSGELTFLAHFSNFIGHYAGAGANNAEYSNFIGNAAGQNALGAYKSNFIGHYAGAGATSANNSNFIGENAGLNSSGNNVNAFGVNAGVNNLLSGMTIFSNSSLPSYLDRASATASITVINGGSTGSTYLYYNETTFTIEAVRLDNY
jgi:hypothetical protein